MAERNPDTTYTKCEQPGCTESLPDHSWGRIKADDWFQQKDGTIWCPDHHPPWVADWRARQREKQR